MSESDYMNYYNEYSKLQNEISKPDVIIFLRTSSEVLLERIKLRGRDYEKDIEKDYLEIINQCYEDYVVLMREKYGVKIVYIETSEKTKIQVGKNVSNAIKDFSGFDKPLVLA